MRERKRERGIEDLIKSASLSSEITKSRELFKVPAVALFWLRLALMNGRLSSFHSIFINQSH